MSDKLNQEQKDKLLKIARNTIREHLFKGEILDLKETDPQLKEPMGAFVTLRKQGQLRGCIGNIIADKPLYLTVRDMAIASATQDPRFRPLNKDELQEVTIEISVLSIPKEAKDPDEIKPGEHGVIVRDGLHGGVYLPQVAAETGWSKKEFMDSLCRDKAGMQADAWRSGKCNIFIFTAQVFSE